MFHLSSADRLVINPLPRAKIGAYLSSEQMNPSLHTIIALPIYEEVAHHMRHVFTVVYNSIRFTDTIGLYDKAAAVMKIYSWNERFAFVIVSDFTLVQGFEFSLKCTSTIDSRGSYDI